MSQQQLGRGSPTSGAVGPLPTAGPDSPPARFVGRLGSLGCAAAGYGVFQALFGVLPDSLGGPAAKWLVSGVSGIGTAVAAWLAFGPFRGRGFKRKLPIRTAEGERGFAVQQETDFDYVTDRLQFGDRLLAQDAGQRSGDGIRVGLSGDFEDAG